MKRPKPVRGLELRARRHRDGTPYWTWRVRWRDPRTGRRLSEEFPTAAEALDFKATLRVRARRGDLDQLDTGRTLLVDFFADTYWPTAGHNLERVTLESYAGTWNRHILPRLGEHELRRITPAVVHRLLTDLAHAGIGGPTRRRVKAVLSAVLAEAVARGELTGNPCREVRTQRQPARTADHTPAPTEIEAIRGQLDPAGATLVTLIGYLGLRPAEALALTDADISSTTVRVDARIVHGRREPSTKTARGRTIWLPGPVRADLAAWRLARPATITQPEGLLFPRLDGQPWRDTDYRNWRARRFKPAATAAGVPVDRPYTLRHAAASLLLTDPEWTIPGVAEHMGHSVAVLSSTYAHVLAGLAGQPRRSFEDAILEARTANDARDRRGA